MAGLNPDSGRFESDYRSTLRSALKNDLSLETVHALKVSHKPGSNLLAKVALTLRNAESIFVGAPFTRHAHIITDAPTHRSAGSFRHGLLTVHPFFDPPPISSPLLRFFA